MAKSFSRFATSSWCVWPWSMTIWWHAPQHDCCYNSALPNRQIRLKTSKRSPAKSLNTLDSSICALWFKSSRDFPRRHFELVDVDPHKTVCAMHDVHKESQLPWSGNISPTAIITSRCHKAAIIADKLQARILANGSTTVKVERLNHLQRRWTLT